MSEPQDENLLRFLAATLESIRDRLDGVEKGIGGLESRMGGLESRMGGLESCMGGLENHMGGLAGRMGGLENRMGVLENRTDAGFTAVRGDLERVNLRLDSIERMLSARLDRVETEMSRLRSVVYLLVKDKPELLRLLGEPSVS